MTDNDKMREAFINACKEYGSTISFSDFEMGWDACMEQAAQSVPVAGEPYLYVRSVHDGWPEYSKEDEFSDGKGGGLALYLKPTTSIAEDELKDLRMCKIAAREEARRVDELTAELERLRKDAERLDVIDRLAEAYGFEDTLEGYEWRINGPWKTIREAIDAIAPAIAAEGEKK